jgi:hypothetical protein
LDTIITTIIIAPVLPSASGPEHIVTITITTIIITIITIIITVVTEAKGRPCGRPLRT